MSAPIDVTPVSVGAEATQPSTDSSAASSGSDCTPQSSPEQQPTNPSGAAAAAGADNMSVDPVVTPAVVDPAVAPVVVDSAASVEPTAAVIPAQTDKEGCVAASAEPVEASVVPVSVPTPLPPHVSATLEGPCVVLIYKALYEDLLRRIDGSPHRETGGDLFGRWTQSTDAEGRVTHTARVEYILEAGPNAYGTTAAFFQGQDPV
jgi:hypothetical protein